MVEDKRNIPGRYYEIDEESKTLVMLGAVGAIAFSALAASVHFKGGNPTFTDNGLTLTSTFCLSGLGNADVTATITATGAGNLHESQWQSSPWPEQGSAQSLRQSGDLR